MRQNIPTLTAVFESSSEALLLLVGVAPGLLATMLRRLVLRGDLIFESDDFRDCDCVPIGDVGGDMAKSIVDLFRKVVATIAVVAAVAMAVGR